MNYYELLGVARTANDREIKRAYNKLLKKYHPDVYRGDEAIATVKTRQIIEAYEALKTEELRAEYDLLIGPELEYSRSLARGRKHAAEDEGGHRGAIGAAVVPALVGLVFMVLLIVAASRSAGPLETALVGEWKFDECICYEANSWNAADVSYDGYDADAEVRIMDGGSFEVMAYGMTETGRWKIDTDAAKDGYDVITLEYDDEDSQLASYFGKAFMLNANDEKSMYYGFAYDKKTDCVLWFYRE